MTHTGRCASARSERSLRAENESTVTAMSGSVSLLELRTSTTRRAGAARRWRAGKDARRIVTR
jgi:hypothetical protein